MNLEISIYLWILLLGKLTLSERAIKAHSDLSWGVVWYGVVWT